MCEKQEVAPVVQIPCKSSCLLNAENVNVVYHRKLSEHARHAGIFVTEDEC